MKRLRHLNILYILKSKDSEVLNTLQENANNLIVKKNIEEIKNVLEQSKIDIIFSEEKISNNILNIIRTEYKNIHIIIYTNSISKKEYFDAIMQTNIKYLTNTPNKEELENIILSVIKNIDSSSSNILYLENDFIYDKYNNTLLKDKEIISLSKKENMFLNYILENKDRAVSYEEINEKLWKGEMTHNALRSVVKEIRRKIYKNLIKNISGVGYRISI
ncbi:winged helix-turn-helix domain-containing protein [Arcobacter sp. YIC-310]|uniref:winged helix-turn-helix domain-containing protein n=1 Tax=Arcobacter sp. YIC-310 TaxID=3376632 RepID=UPI003C1EF051